MAASEGQQPVPPFLPVAPEPRELDQISIMIPDNIVPNPSAPNVCQHQAPAPPIRTSLPCAR